MHLSRLNGHSLVDGHFAVAGFGARPETLAVEANLSRLTFDFENVNLENVGPVRLTYRQDEIRVEQASLRGTDTDFHVTGSARFAGDQALNLRLDGAVSLQLLAGFLPQLEATGRAQVNAAVGGTLSLRASTARFTSRAHRCVTAISRRDSAMSRAILILTRIAWCLTTWWRKAAAGTSPSAAR